MVLEEDLKKDLKENRLRYVNDDTSGYFRQKLGKKGFSYYDTDGKKIRDEKILARINSLAIPPAWQDVWIAPISNAHIQATGIDSKRRKQYIYHDRWLKMSQENKFSKMIDFGLALPKIRGKVAYELKGGTLDKSKILATVLWLLDKTFIRIGNDEYRRENNSYGLTTLRNKHADVKGKTVTFRFTGKSGVENLVTFENKNVADTIKKCIELPGYELFQFIDDEGARHVVDAGDVNDFLEDLTKCDFTAKDFRTWGATNIAAKHLHDKGNGENEKNIKENIKEAILHASQHLNNTVSVCRAYYVHPQIPLSYETNRLVRHFDGYRGRHDIDGLTWREGALVKLLKKTM